MSTDRMLVIVLACVTLCALVALSVLAYAQRPAPETISHIAIAGVSALATLARTMRKDDPQ